MIPRQVQEKWKMSMGHILYQNAMKTKKIKENSKTNGNVERTQEKT